MVAQVSFRRGGIAPGGTTPATAVTPATLGDRGDQSDSLPVVGAEVVLLQRDRRAGRGRPLTERGTGHAIAAGAVAVGAVAIAAVARCPVQRGPGLLGRLHAQRAVPLHPGAGRDELADDDVLLEADQRV